MPSWRLVAGSSAGVGRSAPGSFAPAGFLYFTVEASAQLIVRDTYTLSNLFAMITANTRDSESTVWTRKDGANGNQSVSIPAATTGVFEDITNSDSLVDGEAINYSLALAAGTGTITLSLVATVLSTAANNTPVLMATGYATAYSAETEYYPIMGAVGTGGAEARCQYTFRSAATLSNFAARIRANSLDGESTLYTRVSGAGGAQSLLVPAATTGRFEDTTNTDSIATGDEVNIGITAGGTTGSIVVESLTTKSSSVGRQTAAAIPAGTTLACGLTRYITLEGSSQFFATAEVDTQLTMRIAAVGKNLFVNVPTNSVNNGSTFRTRKNGDNGNLSVSVPASTTGMFEDTTNFDTLVATDTYNYQVVTGGTSGTMVICAVGVELQQEAEAAITKIMSEALSIPESPVRRARASRLAVESVGLADTALRLGASRRFTAEVVTVAEAHLRRGRSLRLADDVVTVPETIGRRGWMTRLIEEAVATADASMRRARSTRLSSETVGIAEAAVRSGKFVMIASEVIGIADSMLHTLVEALIRVMSEVVGIADTSVRRARSIRVIDEIIGIIEGFISSRRRFFPVIKAMLGQIPIIKRYDLGKVQDEYTLGAAQDEYTLGRERE